MSGIPSIFLDNGLQETFDRQGYVVLPLLRDTDVATLLRIYRELHSGNGAAGFRSSSFLPDAAVKRTIRDAVYPVFLPRFEQLFRDFTYFGSSFLCKTPGRESEVPPHQDWTIVDEDRFVAINIWTPLIDTNTNNGTLYVVPGSHRGKWKTLRAPTIPFYYQGYMKQVVRCALPTNAPAGHAVILNQGLIHYSSPNFSADNRIAITSGLKTKNAPMLFHYLNEEGRIERYRMPEDFLLDFGDFHRDIYQRPGKGELLELLPGGQVRISAAEFMKQFGKHRPPIWRRVLEAFR